MALILCHNVTPVYTTVSKDAIEDDQVQEKQPQAEEDSQDDEKVIKEFQAASPDEIALVRFA